MDKEKINITKSNLLTVVLALAAVAVIVAAFVLVTTPSSDQSQATGLVAGQSQGSQTSGSQQGQSALSQLPDMVGGC